jgi:hypothetical protein
MNGDLAATTAKVVMIPSRPPKTMLFKYSEPELREDMRG